MYADAAPFGFHIPAWFWERLRPCDRFLLMKRLFVVDLSSIDGAIINNVADNRPDFADARRIVNKLNQLHVVVGPVYMCTHKSWLHLESCLRHASEMLR